MQLRKIFALALLTTAGLWAAERVSAYRAQLSTPSGPANGIVVTVGNQMLFVDTDQPDLSFAVPRSEVSSVTLQSNGILAAQTAQPFMAPYGTASSLNIRFLNPVDTNSVVQWVGLPAATTLPRTDTEEFGAQQPAGNVSFDVRRDDDNGRLVVTPTGIDFVDISNRSKSKHWTYAELKGVKRDGNEIKIQPYNGDEYKFKTSQLMSDQIYSTIADRIVAARPR